MFKIEIDEEVSRMYGNCNNYLKHLLELKKSVAKKLSIDDYSMKRIGLGDTKPFKKMMELDDNVNNFMTMLSSNFKISSGKPLKSSYDIITEFKGAYLCKITDFKIIDNELKYKYRNGEKIIEIAIDVKEFNHRIKEFDHKVMEFYDNIMK